MPAEQQTEKLQAELTQEEMEQWKKVKEQLKQLECLTVLVSIQLPLLQSHSAAYSFFALPSLELFCLAFFFLCTQLIVILFIGYWALIYRVKLIFRV